jgi:hypothetical protein
VVTLVAALLTGGSGVFVEGDRAYARMLDGSTQSQVAVGFDQAAVGEEWWFALPVPANLTKKKIKVTKAEVLDVPEGLKLLGYHVFRIEDTGGVPLLAGTGAPQMPDFGRLKDYAASGMVVEPESFSLYYFAARLRVTGPVHKETRSCRFEYEQGGERYEQRLGCRLRMRLKS